MKNSYLLIIAAGIVCLTACNKETNAIEETIEANGSVKMITETVTAQYGNETKVTIADGGTFSWTEGDHIAVHVSNGDNPQYVLTSDSGASGASASAATASFTVVYEEGYTRDAFAVYPATIVATDAANYGQSGATLDITLPDTYELSKVSGTTTPCPMIATNTPGSGWAFKQLCGLLRLTVGNISSNVASLELGFGGNKVNGTFEVTNPGTATPKISTTTAGLNLGEDIITITDISPDAEGKVTVNLPLPEGNYSEITIVAKNGNDVVLSRAVESFATAYLSQRAHGKKVTRDLAVFSVDASTKVYFSPGNLQYQASPTSTWRFAEHQYDYVGDGGTKGGNVTGGNNASISSSYTGWIDLFGWGTSGYSEWEDDTYGSAVQPWSSDTNNDNYGPVGVYNGLYKNGADGPDFTNGDWGEGAKDYIGDGWRTLTSAESVWLVGPFFDANPGTNCRTSSRINDTDNARYAKGTVNDVYGMIIFPDSYTHPDGVAVPTGINATDNAGWNGNDYSADEWSKMEAAGAVFLPAAGYRNGTKLYNPGNFGYYWSSSPFDASYASRLYFGSNDVDPAHSGFRRHGCSVRLVQNQN